MQISLQDHSVHLIDFQTSRKAHPEGVECQSGDIEMLENAVDRIHLLKSRFHGSLRYLTSSRQVRSICRENEINVLLSLYGGGFGILAHRSKVRPFAVYVVGSDVLLPRRGTRFFTSRALKDAAVVFSNGEYLAERTRELVPQARIHPLLIGVDVEQFSPSPAPTPPVKIVCNRAFKTIYNNEYLIRGLAETSAQDQDIKVTFPSFGPLLDETKVLTKNILEPELAEKVEFLGGVSDEEMRRIVRSSHIFVSMSRSDGTATSLLEALSCGLFPVLSDIPQNREWIDPALDNGILVPLDQPKALAAALSRAISDAPLRVRAAEVNRQLILDRADARKNMATLTSKLEAVTRNQSTSKRN